MLIGEKNTNSNRVTELSGVDYRSVMREIENIYNSEDIAKSKAAKIGEIISDCINKNTHSNINQSDEDFIIEYIGEGSSAKCYRINKSLIVKLFCPCDLYEEAVLDAYYEKAPNFVWLSNRATETQADRFLERFHRFINQVNNIDKSRNSIIAGGNNQQFIDPSIRLTSHGFAYIANAFSGVTVEEDLKLTHVKLTYVAIVSSQPELRELLYRIRLIRKASENVRKFCHANTSKIFHGDIKPDNFYIIRDKNVASYEDDIVQTIDFDTWISEEDFNNGYAKRMATTPLFYFDMNRVSKNQTIDQWLSYDVTALSRMLIYSLLDVFPVGESRKHEKSNLFTMCQNKQFSWIKYFFKSSSAEQLYKILYADKSIAGLYVFNYIKTILIQCSEFARGNAIDCIDELIVKLRCCEVLIGIMLGNNSDILDSYEARFVRFMYKSFCALDKENKNRLGEYSYGDASKALLGNLVEKRIDELFYGSSQSEDYKIDRRLIPDIDLCDNNRLAYKFDDNGRPISSPLEQALKAANGKSLFLTAEGGQGKTTTLRSFWLDFLSGKHNMPCLYIDCKLLGIDNNTIENYIRKEYGLNIDNIEKDKKPIILLDGVNESHARLRKKSVLDVCQLVIECRELIDKCRIVIGSRTNTITTIDREENMTGVKEFSDKLQYATVCKLHNYQIEHCLIKSEYDKSQIKPLMDLLRNNMMLHIFINLGRYGVKIDPKDMKAGVLLDKYFQICFKARYCKHVCMLKDEEREICELIDKAESSNFNVNDNNDVANIHNNLIQYSKTISYLIDNVVHRYFAVDNLYKNNVSYDILCELSLLKKIDNEKCIWENELYRDYFRAKRLSQTLQLLHDGKFSDRELNVRIVELVMWALHRDYKIFMYAGEMCMAELGNKQFGFFEDMVRAMIDIPMVRKNFGHYPTSAITVISVLCGYGVPQNADCINDGAFVGCDILTEIDIPSSVTKIGDSAFSGCANLAQIRIPQGIESIGNNVFSECLNLYEVRMPDTIKSIGDDAFYGCCKLDKIKIGTKVKTIGNNAFGECHSLAGIKISDNVESIGTGAFQNCTMMSSIRIGRNVKEIGSEAFSGCSELTCVSIPSNVIAIGEKIFDGCKKLKRIKIDAVIRDIGRSLIWGCKPKVIIMSRECYEQCKNEEWLLGANVEVKGELVHISIVKIVDKY